MSKIGKIDKALMKRPNGNSRKMTARNERRLNKKNAEHS